MAESINRTLRDGASLACFEVVYTGDAGGETDTVVDVSALDGSSGDGSDFVRVKKVTALVCGPVDSNVSLTWDGDDDAFLTLPHGFTELSMTFSPTVGSTGDISFTSTASAPFTLRLLVEKTNGFTLSTANLTSM